MDYRIKNAVDTYPYLFESAQNGFLFELSQNGLEENFI
jgi:hypothetical protein